VPQKQTKDLFKHLQAPLTALLNSPENGIIPNRPNALAHFDQDLHEEGQC
jgi:hypothetical protein